MIISRSMTSASAITKREAVVLVFKSIAFVRISYIDTANKVTQQLELRAYENFTLALRCDKYF